MRKNLLKTMVIAVGIAVSLNVNAQAPNWQWISSGGDSNLGGTNYATACINDGQGNTLLSGFQGQTMAIQKFDGNGSLIWTSNITQKSILNKISDIAADSEGNIYVAGNFRDTCYFGSTMLVAVPGNNWTSAGFIAKLDANGNFLWAIKGNGNSRCETISVDENNNVLVGGYVGNNLDLEIAGLTVSKLSTGKHIFIAKINPSGSGIWGKVYGASYPSAPSGSDCSVNDIKADKDGNILFTGTLNAGASSNFDGVTLSTNGAVFYIAKTNSSGDLQWVRKSTSTQGEASGQGVGTDAGGNIYVIGWIKGNADFGGFNATYTGDVGFTNTLVLVKYNPAGTELWVKAFGKVKNDYVTSRNVGFATSATGNNYIGSTAGTNVNGGLNFGDGVTNSTPLNGKIVNYVAIVDSTGITKWAKVNNSNIGDIFYNLSIDNVENIYVCGQWIEGSGYDLLSPPSGTTGILLAKLGNNSPSTNIIENTTYTTFSVYPNPTIAFVTLANIPNGSAINIIDITGKVVYNSVSKTENHTINTSDFINGVYIVQIMDKGNIATQKLVVSK